jgi:ribosomal protein S1
VRDPLTPDLEQEFEAAMNAASFDELMGDGPTSVGGGLESGARVTGKVIRLNGDDVFWSLGGPNEGVSSLRQFEQPPELGMELEVVVRGFNSEDGLHEVALPGAAIEADDWEDLEEGSVVEARITGANTGGLECKVNQMRGFIPASQVAMFRVEDYAEFIDQKLVCIVTEVNPRRKNLVLSRRAVLEREREEERKKLMESLEVGNTVEGTVRNLRDFGAFVDLGGVDGLIHISQLSWDRVEHPKEVLEVGQKVRVKIEKIDPQTGKIGLSYRDLLEHPWTNIDEKFSVDSEVTGTVSRIAQFGAFVKLAPGIEGLVHISELSHARVATVGSVVSEGEAVNVKVLSVDRDAQRIALSMKAVLPIPEPEAESSDGAAAEDVPPPELAVPKRDGPLKGGTGSKSGGEQFGLKW